MKRIYSIIVHSLIIVESLAQSQKGILTRARWWKDPKNSLLTKFLEGMIFLVESENVKPKQNGQWHLWKYQGNPRKL